jgi:hypothetical protein
MPRLRSSVMSITRRRTETIDTVRSSAFYDTIEKERLARGWRVRQFGDWLGLGDRLYRWRTLKPPNLPESETLIRMAVRLEWPLDRLLRGVSAAYDAQADQRRNNTISGSAAPPQVLPPAAPAPLPPALLQHEGVWVLYDKNMTADHWTVVRIVAAMTPEEAVAARSWLRKWAHERDAGTVQTQRDIQTHGGKHDR